MNKYDAIPLNTIIVILPYLLLICHKLFSPDKLSACLLTITCAV